MSLNLFAIFSLKLLAYGYAPGRRITSDFLVRWHLNPILFVNTHALLPRRCAWPIRRHKARLVLPKLLVTNIRLTALCDPLHHTITSYTHIHINFFQAQLGKVRKINPLPSPRPRAYPRAQPFSTSDISAKLFTRASSISSAGTPPMLRLREIY